ncbi:MAG TPA: glycosyltransferase [Acidimicrobiia bacterium]
MTRVGLIARATDSGLGYLSLDFHRHFEPDETLVIVDADPRYQDHLDWFPGAATMPYLRFDQPRLEAWMADLDVVMCYETFYQLETLRAARSTGTRTVLMGMPELTRRDTARGYLGDPDLYVWPTTWLMHELPGEYLPIPVTPQPECNRGRRSDALSILHVVGQPALADRNGTDIFLTALRMVPAEIDVRICAADISRLDLTKIPDNVHIDLWGNVPNRYLMYNDCDLLVLPRRYGGLSLPVLEAMSCGLAVMMPDCPPQSTDWPILSIPCLNDGVQKCPAGWVPRHFTAPGEVAARIEQVAYDRNLVDKAAEAARSWTRANSWSALAPAYTRALGRACGSTC